MSVHVMRLRNRLHGRVVVIAAVAAAFAGGPTAATAAVYTVSGAQVSVSETQSTMTGGLNGNWTASVTEYRWNDATGRLIAWGTESFTGCLDRRRDGCDRTDPQGTMSFKFTAWQKYDPRSGYAFVTGACIHPVTGGTDGFRGARGVITMKDTLQSDSTVSTSYSGVLTIPAGVSTKSTGGGGSSLLTRVPGTRFFNVPGDPTHPGYYGVGGLARAAAPRVTCGS